ncbi:hypothetical protein MSIM_50990 [Mycobacterium simiae]|nr:hypothetical protein MSIM_50990 [Mycobacterium simiae]
MNQFAVRTRDPGRAVAPLNDNPLATGIACFTFGSLYCSKPTDKMGNSPLTTTTWTIRVVVPAQGWKLGLSQFAEALQCF